MSRSADNANVSVVRVHQFYRTVRTAFKCITIAACIYFLAGALAPFAGKDTALSFALSFIADLKFVASVALTGGATAWAVTERLLRQRKTQYLQDRIIELETKLDANRSTSGLTRTGKTNPIDRRK